MTWTEAQPISRRTGLHALDVPQPPPAPIELLLLEDSAFDAQALSRTLDRIDLPVTVSVADGFAAFRAAITRKRFDLVLLDYLLPGGDGLAAYEMLRATPGHADVPAVVISNEMRHEVAIAVMKSGCIDCLSKDALDPGALRDLVLRATRPQPGFPPGLLNAIRQAVRGEISAAQLPVDLSQMHVALSAFGLAPAPEAQTEWEALLQEEETHFDFHDLPH